VKRQRLSYEVILEPSEEGGFTAYVPALRGCVSEGETEEDALENIRDAISVWLDTWNQVADERGALRRTVEIVR
jgi:predicted RNase H-like HicB family nuclease